MNDEEEDTDNNDTVLSNNQTVDDANINDIGGYSSNDITEENSDISTIAATDYDGYADRKIYYRVNGTGEYLPNTNVLLLSP